MISIFGFELVPFIEAAGYLGIFAIVFVESGIPFGFFLPGDSLLFTAGFLSSQGYFSIFILAPLCFVAAVLGDSFGYAFGRRAGPYIFNREDSFFFNKAHIERTKIFYEKHGKIAIVFARFVPAVRTFVPIFAGIGNMRYATFLSYNILGGALWAIGLTMLGYFFGNFIPNPDRYIIPVVGGIILLSFLPAITHVIRIKIRR